MNKLEHALWFLDRGISIVPVHSRSKIPLVDWKYYQSHLPSHEQAVNWLSGNANYGVVCGWNGLAVLDFDSQDIYKSWRSWASNSSVAYPVQEQAFRVKTARGLHVYICLQHPSPPHHYDGLDAKTLGGYALGPGSIHPSGILYTPENQPDLLLVDTLESLIPPEWQRREEVLPERQGRSDLDPWSVCTNGLSKRGQVDLIKRLIPIESFFPDRKPSGRGMFSVRCPFHEDKRNSAWVNTERGIFGCFVGCLPHPVDVIDFFALLNHISVQDAIRDLSRRL